MPLSDLTQLLASAKWFSRIGEPDYEGKAGIVRLQNLEEWRSVTGMLPNERMPRLFDEGMERLPTSPDEEDPIHGRTLVDRAIAIGKKDEFAKTVLDVNRAALSSLREFVGHPLLRVGPHDFTEGARGAALFAFRQAAWEVLLEEPSFWVAAARIYSEGHWPFGSMPDGRIVVL